ncbi:MAG: GNAT family N-acetyltransferase [Actinobacteria bacterium]|nr:GNAT family N-acetyltransferase [Actinomycetota bacterium]
MEHLDLEFYPTSVEHAKKYGIKKSTAPLFLYKLFVEEEYRLSGIGKKALEYIDEYAKENKHDIVFGHIPDNCDIDLIKNWLSRNGYSLNNNDFHKVVKQY